MKNKISVIIITGNEQNNIAECLESIKWADEIIVVDSESTDDTVSIARQFTKNIFIRKWEGFSNQKKYALSLASNEWVLSIDADERATKELTEEILIKDLDSFNGYFIRRQNYFLGKLITTCGWEKDYQLRLFRKTDVMVTDKLVHEGFIVKGKSGTLDSTMIHYPNETIDVAIAKANRYSTLLAEAKTNEGAKYGILRLLVQQPVSFYHYYFARKGFRDGIHGFLISLLHSLSELMLVSKIWELHRNRHNLKNIS